VEIKGKVEPRSSADDRAQASDASRPDDRKSDDREFREQQVDKYLRKDSR
jgi:hypothetical protein